MLESFYKSFYSKEFYADKLAEGGKKAAKHMFAFWTIIGLVFALFSFLTTGLSARRDLSEFSTQDFPNRVSMIDGKLSVDGVDMPIEFAEGGQYFALDTTGEIVEIPSGYSDAAVFTEDRILYRSKDGYGDQEALYSTIVNNDIEFTKEDIVDFANVLSIWLLVLIPVFKFLSIFNSNIMGILMVTIVGAIVLKFMKKQNTLRRSFIISVYAAFPVFVVTFFQNLFGMIVPDILSLFLCCFGFVFLFVKWGYFFWLGASTLKD